MASIGIPDQQIEKFISNDIHLLTFSMMKNYDDYYDNLLGLDNFAKIFKDKSLYDTFKGLSRNEDVDLSPIIQLIGGASSKAEKEYSKV
jgi:hypothetical protein